MLRLHGGMPSAIFKSPLSGKHFKARSKLVAKEGPNRERYHEMAADWANDVIRDLARLFESRERDGIDQITAINPHPGGKLSESLGGSTT